MLAIGHGYALACVQLVQRLARELAVAGELAHCVVHIAIARLIGQALVLQRANHAQHLRHVLSGAWLMRWALNAQGIGVLMQRLDHAIGQRPNGFTVVHRTLNDLVINIGDVAHIGNAIATGTQPALDHVKSDHGARMTQMTQVIHGHAAYIHAHMAGFDWRKRFQCTR